jgi:MSHA biogenesis protein MshK
MAGRLITLIAGFLVASAWASIGHGQLADPTKPPAALAAPAPDAAAVGAAAVGLQSVIMRKNGKPAALINGEVVELGGKLGEAKLVKITEDAVVLRGPQGDETLRLTPAAEKKVGAGETVKKSASGASRKEGAQ